MEEFVDRDADYERWLAAHPHGFVVNTTRSPSAGYLVLHASTCRTISGQPANGKSWTHDYIKVCADAVSELDRWAQSITGGGQIHRCGLCHPTA